MWRLIISAISHQSTSTILVSQSKSKHGNQSNGKWSWIFPLQLFQRPTIVWWYSFTHNFFIFKNYFLLWWLKILAGKAGAYSWVAFQSESPLGSNVQIGNTDDEDIVLEDATKSQAQLPTTTTSSTGILSNNNQNNNNNNLLLNYHDSSSSDVSPSDNSQFNSKMGWKYVFFYSYQSCYFQVLNFWWVQNFILLSNHFKTVK